MRTGAFTSPMLRIQGSKGSLLNAPQSQVRTLKLAAMFKKTTTTLVKCSGSRGPNQPASKAIWSFWVPHRGLRFVLMVLMESLC